MVETRYSKKLIKPILKWVGGKRLLFNEIIKRLPNQFNTYIEPFVGGGYVFFNIKAKKYIINDTNQELINLYNVVKNNPYELIKELKKFKNNKKEFYEIRSWDRDLELFNSKSNVEKAARIVYLNKTCYNGLYRVNTNGELNTPFGNYKNPVICNEQQILEISNYFKNNKVKILNKDFSKLLLDVKKNDFVYLDPPYDPISDSSSFTGYSHNGFNWNDQIRLKKFCDEIDKKNAYFMLSNSNTKRINELYKNYKISKVLANRSINSDGNKRNKVYEVLITNYEW